MDDFWTIRCDEANECRGREILGADFKGARRRDGLDGVLGVDSWRLRWAKVKDEAPMSDRTKRETVMFDRLVSLQQGTRWCLFMNS